jgi:ribosomal-protein-alanine N-acetyltransferase
MLNLVAFCTSNTPQRFTLVPTWNWPQANKVCLTSCSMRATPIHTKNLTLVPNTLDDVRKLIDGMDAHERAQVSDDWLARVHGATADHWTLGYTLMHRTTEAVVGTCGFKGPPTADRTVEIAYGVAADHQRRGYATEAAEALVAYAFSSGEVRVVRAHTFSDANASTRVLEKCGFRRIGEVVDPEDGLVVRWEKESEASP